MVLRTDSSRSAEPRLRALLEVPAGPHGRRLGVEHEYAVYEGDTQVDFRAHLHHLGFPGRALHPTNTDAILTPSGFAVMADGLVAETASPPERLGRGSATALVGWAEQGRVLIEDHLPTAMWLVPGSTHVSVETRASRADQLCLWFAQTFAPAAMLLMDRADSPGILIRPRPHRFELGGEFIAGERLQALVTFLAGAVIALEEGERLPPAVEVTAEPARRRFGWYVDRRAFGPDLYAEGRDALLGLRAGGTTTAQQQLEDCWSIARKAVRPLASPEELAAVDRLVNGETPLPSEDAEWQGSSRTLAVPANPFGRLSQSRPGITIEPASATWDYVAFTVSALGKEALVNVPYPYLAGFLDAFEAGDLDEVLANAAREVDPARILATYAQTGEVGVFSSVAAGDALLPRDRMGIGPGAVSTVRPGKVEPPPPAGVQPPPVTQSPPSTTQPPPITTQPPSSTGQLLDTDAARGSPPLSPRRSRRSGAGSRGSG